MQHHLDMYATKVQHSPSATISVKPSTRTVWRVQFDAYSLTHTFDKSTLCTTLNALRLPLQRNAARQTQRFIGNECNSCVPKCSDAVCVFETLVIDNGVHSIHWVQAALNEIMSCGTIKTMWIYFRGRKSLFLRKSKWCERRWGLV